MVLALSLKVSVINSVLYLRRMLLQKAASWCVMCVSYVMGYTRRSSEKAWELLILEAEPSHSPTSVWDLGTSDSNMPFSFGIEAKS